MALYQHEGAAPEVPDVQVAKFSNNGRAVGRQGVVTVQVEE